MAQISLGVCERLSIQAIRLLYPAEVEKHEKDPYHHRYPRAEVSPLSSRFSSPSLPVLVVFRSLPIHPNLKPRLTTT